MENSLLSVKQAATYLGLKESNLYSKVERQEIPHYRVGRLIRFKRDDLDTWLTAQKVDCRDLKEEAQKTLSASRKSNSSVDIDALMKKAIAEKGRARYNFNNGKPDRSKGHRKEVYNEYN